MIQSSLSLPKQLELNLIKTQQLQLLIIQFLSKLQHNQKPYSYRYKFNLQKILPLPQQLLSKVILYIIYVKFHFVIHDPSQQHKLSADLFLKQIYQQQFYHGKWKKQFHFQFTLIYLTKVTSQFVNQYFPSLQINQNLQSQFFIILHKLFIGNQIGTKLYHVISKKYLKHLNPKSAKPQIKPSISVPKKDSFVTAYKPSTKYISQVMHSQSYGGTKHRILYTKDSNSQNHQNINSRKNHFRNKISFLKYGSLPQKTNFDIFNEQLKKNLYVDPLPVIQPKKMDITEYQILKCGGIEGSQKRKLGQIFIKPVHLRTTKITSSMQTLLSMNHPSLSTHSFTKPGKILLSRQLNSKHYCLTSSSNHNDSNDKPLTQLFDKEQKLKNSSQKNTGKLTFQEWNMLLKKIKLTSKNSTLFEKQNISLGKSFESNSQNHSMHQMSYQKNKKSQEYRQSIKHNQKSDQALYNKLKTQNNQNYQSKAYAHRKSQTLDMISQVQDNKFSKLGVYTTSIDPGTRAVTNYAVKGESNSIFKKISVNPQQKLSKTCKLKLAKLTFISQCKQRQKKISSSDNQWQIQNENLSKKIVY